MRGRGEKKEGEKSEVRGKREGGEGEKREVRGEEGGSEREGSRGFVGAKWRLTEI